MWGLVVIFAVALIFLNVRFQRYFYGDYNRDPLICNLFQVDLLEACDWVSGRYDNYGAIYVTAEGMNMPYIITLVALNYDPHDWFREPKVFFTHEEWDYYARYGKMVFMYPGMSVPDMSELKQRSSGGHILFIVRPGELGLTDPVYRISDPTGKECLWLCQL